MSHGASLRKSDSKAHALACPRYQMSLLTAPGLTLMAVTPAFPPPASPPPIRRISSTEKTCRASLLAQ